MKLDITLHKFVSSNNLKFKLSRRIVILKKNYLPVFIGERI